MFGPVIPGSPFDPSLDATFVSSFDPSHDNVGGLVGSSVDVDRAESDEFARHASVLWTARVPAPTNSSAISKEAETKAFIYFKESTNRLDAENDYGCKGLGQDCNGRLAVECPNWQADRACQDSYRDRYMASRHGSWVAADAHWLARVPINGQYVRNWW